MPDPDISEKLGDQEAYRIFIVTLSTNSGLVWSLSKSCDELRDGWHVIRLQHVVYQTNKTIYDR